MVFFPGSCPDFWAKMYAITICKALIHKCICKKQGKFLNVWFHEKILKYTVNREKLII